MLDLVADGLAVGNLRGTDVGFDFEFALQTVHQNVEMQFAHALHDRLTRFQIRLHAEGRVLGRQTREAGRHFFLVSLGLGLNSDLDHRIGERHCF